MERKRRWKKPISLAALSGKYCLLIFLYVFKYHKKSHNEHALDTQEYIKRGKVGVAGFFCFLEQSKNGTVVYKSLQRFRTDYAEKYRN